MNSGKKISTMVVWVSAIVLAIALWFSGGALWRLLLAMHGHR